ncbi:TRAF family member-associated NF-kappa-B activator-like isoform X1 [Entelurus aequoreus]|uniref:TRAF family member-associated NF-kappa-B activator-like isoform X1 n=1 Tax=Entelurus aequoreus TaxID=161455 RepID=UPI002B1D685B|nr:TRAF family member-associated NF-kappa-B activator-like isoform X1 [Entelurus aequoreus]
MERNIGDQLNKAFEAYRQVSIEKDNAKKELQQITDYYQRHTEKLLKQIEDQQQLICQLKAQLSARRKPAVEENSEACNHLPDGTCSHVETQHLDNTAAVTPARPVHGSVEYQDMLGALEAIHGTFRQIRSLSRRQKDQLKRFCGGLEMANGTQEYRIQDAKYCNNQQFSMPIQCTDHTADKEPAVSPPSLASRGASPDDKDFVDSLTNLSVKFPPSADSEYDFLNSAPQRHLGPGEMRPPPGGEEEAVPSELPAVPFVYPPFPLHTVCRSSSPEDVRGPQQSLWLPQMLAPQMLAPQMCAEAAGPGSSVPDKCAFCQAVVPQECMNSHLYSHFSPEEEHRQ